MPHQVFNADEVAEYLHMSRAEVDDLAKRREIPFEDRGGRLVFRRQEIDAWGSQRVLALEGRQLDDYHRTASARRLDLSQGAELMPVLIDVDLIEPALTSRTKSSVLRDLVALADGRGMLSDPAALLCGLEEREKLCSTALPGGLALLHVRHQDPFLFLESFVACGRVTQTIYAGAPDGSATDLFFLICCQDDRSHLHTLARLCSMCMNTGMLAALRSAADAKSMRVAILDAEKQVLKHM